MGTFNAFQNILPDPNNLLSEAGSASSNEIGASAGPGFTSVKFTAKQPVMMNRTNSGRVITRSVAAHSWDIDISYNSLTRAEFEPVFSFLMSRNGKLNPFFIELPQYLTSQDSTFAASVISNPPVTSVKIAEGSAVPAGRTYFRTSYTGSGTPRQGDIFTISDASNVIHTKAYMVTRVETSTDFNNSFDAATNPGTNQFRIHFSPPLVSATSDTSPLDFTEPRIRVIQAGDVQEYSLGVNGLYKFSLKVEEAAP